MKTVTTLLAVATLLASTALAPAMGVAKKKMHHQSQITNQTKGKTASLKSHHRLQAKAKTSNKAVARMRTKAPAETTGSGVSR